MLRLKRYLPFVVGFVALVALACSSAVAPTPTPTEKATVEEPKPTPTPTPTPTEKATVEEPKPTPTPIPTPTEKATVEEPKPTATPTPTEVTPASTPTPPASTPSSGNTGVSQEQLEEELRRLGTSAATWPKTNFQIRTVSLTEYRGGGPGKDDIPAIDNPKFDTVEQGNLWLKGREPVQVVNINGDVRAYPLGILIWHEIINDVVGGEPVSITY